MHIKLTASREAPVALYGYHTLHNALERSLPYGDNTTGSPCHA